MTWIRIGSALAVLLALAGGASADEAESRAIAKGRWSLAFSLPDGGGSQLGVWRRVSGRSNLGLNLGIDHSRETDTIGPDSSRQGEVNQFWTFSIEPSLERYLVLQRDVSPYVFAALQGSYGWTESSFQKSYSRSATLSFGLGADWTPLESISIGAATGIRWRESMRSESAPDAPKQGQSQFGSVATSLQLHLYF
jgi:hypothetical protein